MVGDMNTGLDAALGRVQNLAQRCVEPKTHVWGDPRKCVVVIDGQAIEKEIPPTTLAPVSIDPRREFVVHSLNDLAYLVKRYGFGPWLGLAELNAAAGDQQHVHGPLWMSVLWSDGGPPAGCLGLQLCERLRLGLARLECVASPAAVAVGKLLSRPFTQVELLAALRAELFGCVQNVDLALAVRTLKIAKQSEHEQTNDARQSGLGRSVVARAVGADQLPETIDVRLRLFSAPRTREVVIRLALSLNLDDASFTLRPLGDTIAEAVEETVSGLREDWRLACEEHGVAEVTVVLGQFK